VPYNPTCDPRVRQSAPQSGHPHQNTLARFGIGALLCSGFGSRLQFLQRGVHAIARQHYSTIGTVNLAYQMSEYRQLNYHRILRTVACICPNNCQHNSPALQQFASANQKTPAMRECWLSTTPETSTKRRKCCAFLHQCVVKIAPTATMTRKRATFAIFPPIEVKIFRFKTTHMLRKCKIIRGQHEQ
jgi:hypothetical protein